MGDAGWGPAASLHGDGLSGNRGDRHALVPRVTFRSADYADDGRVWGVTGRWCPLCLAAIHTLGMLLRGRLIRQGRCRRVARLVRSSMIAHVGGCGAAMRSIAPGAQALRYRTGSTGPVPSNGDSVWRCH